MNEKWFALDISQIEKKLKTSAASGLSRKAARSRYDKEETPIFSTSKKKRGIMLLELLFDFSFLILLVASVFSLFFESERQIGFVLLVLLVLNLAVSFGVYEYAQSTEEKHRESFQPAAKVIREGKLYHMDYTKVVPGDVVMIEAGDVLQADIRLVTSESLKVYMQIAPEQYQLLEKYADGMVRENENDARSMVNILHAGSVVEEGSARGIVVAVGRFTYLGAMLRGRQQEQDHPIPICLKRWKKIFSIIGLIAMAAVIPLAALGLIGNKIVGGTGLLSTVFLTVLSLSALFFVAKIATCCQFFFFCHLRFLSKSKRTVAVRSAEIFERVSGIDYLFVLDGSILTDGVLHCERTYSFSGETFSDRGNESNSRYLLELVALYADAEKKGLTISASSRTAFAGALETYVEESRVDTEALKIRCSVQSFLHGNLDRDSDRLYFTDRGQKKILSVFSSPSLLRDVEFYYHNGRIEKMMPADKEKLFGIWSHHAQKGKRLLGFSVSDSENGISEIQTAFVGCLILTEGVDTSAVQQMQRLEQMGVRTILFRHPDTTILQPNIPLLKRELPEISIETIRTNNLSLTHCFGQYGAYSGCSEADILELLRYAHAQRARVGVVSFTEFAPEVVREADLFISCASVNEDLELRKNEIPGLPASTSCTQAVKMQAELLVERPMWKQNTGGLSSLVFAIQKGNLACRNLKRFFEYLITAQAMRILFSVFPVLIGYPELDARHVLLFGCVMDWVAFFCCSAQLHPVCRKERDIIFKTTKKVLFAQYLPWITAAIVGFFAAFLLPRLVGAISDGYLYRSEFSFFTLLLLHVVLLGYILFFFDQREIRISKKHMYSFVAPVGGIVLFFFLGLTLAPLGAWFDWIQLPLPYVVIAPIPAVLFVLALYLFPRLKRWLR